MYFLTWHALGIPKKESELFSKCCNQSLTAQLVKSNSLFHCANIITAPYTLPDLFSDSRSALLRSNLWLEEDKNNSY